MSDNGATEPGHDDAQAEGVRDGVLFSQVGIVGGEPILLAIQ